jgi:thiamine biosynthesis lipoprotein
MTRLTRRRALFIGAAAAATAGLGQAARAASAEWQGSALGAHARISLRHLSQPEAAPVFAAVEAELLRLEAIFSLYRSDSAISVLNRDGRLAAPAPELLDILTLAATAHAETGGLFDPTVQPLYRLYAEAAGQVGPEALEAALAKVGFDALRFDAGAVAFARPGMGLTLNGIAQGHVTDRIAALLREKGLRDILVDIGEIAALGNGPSGSGWRVQIADGGPVLELSDRAIATSAALGTVLDQGGRIGHILHPRKGWVQPQHRQVSVVDESAASADALSTAAVLMQAADLAALETGGRRIIAL